MGLGDRGPGRNRMLSVEMNVASVKKGRLLLRTKLSGSFACWFSSAFTTRSPLPPKVGH